MTRMHSSKMRTTRSSSRQLCVCGGGSASVHAGIHPPGVGLETPPLGVGLETPHPPPNPSSSSLGVGLETCKACLDTPPPPETFKVCWDTTPKHNLRKLRLRAVIILFILSLICSYSYSVIAVPHNFYYI